MTIGPFWHVNGYWLQFVLENDNFVAQIAKADESKLEYYGWEPDSEELSKFDIQYTMGANGPEQHKASYRLQSGQLFYTEWKEATYPEEQKKEGKLHQFAIFQFSKIDANTITPLIAGYNPFPVNTYKQPQVLIAAKDLPPVPTKLKPADKIVAKQEEIVPEEVPVPVVASKVEIPAQVAPAPVQEQAPAKASSETSGQSQPAIVDLDALTEEEMINLAIQNSLEASNTTEAPKPATAPSVTPAAPASKPALTTIRKQTVAPKLTPEALAPVVTAPTEPRDPKLDDIIKLVEQAQSKYEGWFTYHYGSGEKKNELKDYPYANGFFTRFRHGSTGQKNAKIFLASLQDKSVKTPADAIALINKKLTNSSTRFNNHSFATFLMIELKKLNAADLGDLAQEEHFANFTYPALK